MFYVGVDLGQRRDHSAIVVVERRERRRAFLEPAFQGIWVRHVERVPLGTPYAVFVEEVRRVVNCAELAGQCQMAVDGTGVGAPVVEMLRTARVGCEITAVTITGGQRAHAQRCLHGAGGQAWSVPKQDLIAGVQALLERRELRIARGLREAELLVKELTDVRATAGRDGRMRLGAEGTGQHDDLVIALALACWRAPWKRCGFGNRRLAGI